MAKAGPQFLTLSFFADGSIEVSDANLARSIADMAAVVLADGPLTARQIGAAILEATGGRVAEDSIGRMLRRHRERSTETGTKGPKQWADR
jgi:hypothetical protein